MRSLLHIHFREVISLQTRYGYYAKTLHWCTDQAITNALAQMDLTAAQGRIMGYLAHRDPAPCSRDVEEAFHLSHPTVSGLLSRLEKKGFIEFRPDQTDRRCKRIYILSKGMECNQRIHQVIQETEAQISRDFTPEEQELFTQFMTRAIANMGGGPCHRKHKEEPNT